MISKLRRFVVHVDRNTLRVCSNLCNGQSTVCNPRRALSSFGVRDFYKQEEAFSFADKNALSVYVMETQNIKRLFVAESQMLFWEKYIKLPENSRHCYEVIRENYPCNLYFDLEFERAQNSLVDGKLLVTIWIEYVNECLWRLFRIRCNRDRVIELDSSTDVKFSQHLIWNIPNTAFKDNWEVGLFVKKICLKLNEYLKSGIGWLNTVAFSGNLDILLIKTSKEDSKLFVDQAVYTKNRQFRLYLSSKLGKDAVLNLSEDCKFEFENLQTTLFNEETKHMIAPEFEKEKTIYFNSLVTGVQKDQLIELLEMPEEITFPVNSVAEPKIIEETFFPITHKQSSITRLPTLGNSEPNGKFPNGSSLSYEEIQNLANNFVIQYKPQAFVEFSMEYKDNSIIVYKVHGSRYCENIGREHKHNQIMVVANYSKQTMYQKCHDPDCDGFKSRQIPFDSL